MKITLPIVMVWICALRLAAQSSDAVKIAVISDSDFTATVADVLTADLSREKNIQLLERAEVEKVYHEQELFAGNRDYLRMGQVLGANGLLVLETVKAGTNLFLNSRLIAVKTGIVLISERVPMPKRDPAGWADGYVPHIEPMLGKLLVGESEAVPISIVNLRSAFQNPDEIELERNLTLLLTDRLTQERNLFVLERRRMQSLAAEKDLNPIDDSSFWNGSYLVEGTIDRDGYSPDKATISLRLVPPNGGAPINIELSGERTNVSGLVLQLASHILARLNVKPGATAWKPLEEADQYENEARWALRWGLYEAAQSASESAWALGKRAPQTAVLRIRSYSESLGAINETSGNINVPAVPDAALLSPSIRTLDLYCAAMPLVVTNPTQMYNEWFDLGMKSLERTADLLDGFYTAFELRAGNEEKLAELRASLRRFVPVLDSQMPPIADYYGQIIENRPAPKGMRFDGPSRRDFERVKLVEWEQGGLWFEKPEDSESFFRQQLERGTVPESVPRIVGWTWEDRKRVPQVTRQFIAGLCQSTNEEIRLAGNYLSVLRAPNDGTSSLRDAEEKLIEGLWEQRTNFLNTSDKAPLLTKTEMAIAEKRGNYFHGPYHLEPWASFRQRMRLCYIAESTNWTTSLTYFLFPSDPANFTREEAEALLPALQGMKQRSSRNRYYPGVLNTVARAAGKSQLATNAPPQFDMARPGPQVAEPPLPVHFQRWNVDELKTVGASPRLLRIICRQDKVWGLLYMTADNGFGIPPSTPASFASVDLKTGQAETVMLPQALGSPSTAIGWKDGEQGYPTPCFDVSDDSLFVSLPGKLARYRFASKAWETMALPTEPCGGVTIWNGFVYFANADVLLEINPDTKAIQTLASSRRSPVNELDPVWNTDNQVMTDWGGRLGVETTKGLFVADAEKRHWDKIERPTNMFSTFPARFPAKGSLGILTVAPAPGISRSRMVEVSTKHALPELLLEQVDPANPNAGGKVFANEKPRWQWPDPFALEVASFALQDENLWSVQPRKFHFWMNPFQSYEPVIFKDDRNATLLRFAPGIPGPMTVPLRFEKAGQPFDPFVRSTPGSAPRGWSPFRPSVAEWLVTEQGVVVIGLDEEPGHWLVPGAEIEKRWNAFLKSARTENLAKPGTSPKR